MEHSDVIPRIDAVGTGRQIRKYMILRKVSVESVKESLSLGCVQSVYHWLNGKSLPSLDNLFALSRYLQVPMDVLIVEAPTHVDAKTEGSAAEQSPSAQNFASGKSGQPGGNSRQSGSNNSRQSDSNSRQPGSNNSRQRLLHYQYRFQCCKAA